MRIVGALDVHRKQITFKLLDMETGEVRRGRITPATRASVRRWLAPLAGSGAHFALEATTGWRFVVEEIERAGCVGHLAETTETAARRGHKRRAKTDAADCDHMLKLLVEERLPEAWIPPEHILELRSRVRLRKSLVDERHEWQQRLQAQLYHQGVRRGIRLRTAAGRAELARAELSPAGREQIECALRMIDHLDRQLQPLDRALHGFARRQPGCRVLQELFGVGQITSVAILAELGDCRRFGSSDDAVRHSGLDVTVWSSDGRRAPGHLARQGPEVLRWALYEAAQSAARSGSPDHAYYLRVRKRIDHNRACLSVARKLCRRAYHILRAHDDEALAPVECQPVEFPQLAQAA
jgi:transposase